MTFLKCDMRGGACALFQVVSEKLSAHVLQNYDKFVSGVNEVVCVERDLQVTPSPSRKLASSMFDW